MKTTEAATSNDVARPNLVPFPFWVSGIKHERRKERGGEGREKEKRGEEKSRKKKAKRN